MNTKFRELGNPCYFCKTGASPLSLFNQATFEENVFDVKAI
jgi:hypothetical protein